jgi:3-hydroxybutyryl-CoA dehydrogenase
MPVTTVEPTAVVGAGTMGGGSPSWPRATVTRFIWSDAARRPWTARERIERTPSFLAAEGYCEAVTAGGAASRVRGSTHLAVALRDARFIIEAVPEDPSIKRSVYRAIEAHGAREAIVASTTSGLNVFELAPDFPGPERLLIAHFWNPAYLIPLVEVVPGPRTSPAVVD